MWHLNYCSPFLFEEGQNPMTYRYIMYSEIFALFLVYLVQILMYRFAGKEQLERPRMVKQDMSTLNKGLRMGCAKGEYWVSSKKFKEWYLSYYGIHTVAVGICILYSPYLTQMIFTLIHFVLWVIVTVLFHFIDKNRKWLVIFYDILMIITSILNIMLLFSGAMGVGASGYDENAKICLLQSGQLEDL